MEDANWNPVPDSPDFSPLGESNKYTLSTLTTSNLNTESTVLSGVHPREVLRCRRCTLVQFRTMNDLCRRCEFPLPPPPKLELESNEALSKVGEGGSASLRFAAGHNGIPSRTRTARELTIGRRLRELRDQRRYTQQDMATKAGVPRTYISRIENARLLPGPVMLRRIADALEVGILDLLPQNKNGSGDPMSLPAGASTAEETYWTALTGFFVQLQPSQMAAVLEHVRGIAGENSGNSFVAAPTVTSTWQPG